MFSPAELISDFILQPLFEWLFGKLSKPIQLGCFAIIGIAVLGGVSWYLISK